MSRETPPWDAWQIRGTAAIVAVGRGIGRVSNRRHLQRTWDRSDRLQRWPQYEAHEGQRVSGFAGLRNTVNGAPRGNARVYRKGSVSQHQKQFMLFCTTSPPKVVSRTGKIMFNRAALVHVVLIAFRETASAEDRRSALAIYQTLGENCGGADAGILYWRVSENLDQRKGWHLVEFSVFSDQEALQCFRRHPAHVAVTDRFRNIVDWAVGDIDIFPCS